MPYIAIKAFPKDEATKQALVERINQAVLDTVGCPPEAVTISMEEFAPEEWNEKVKEPEILKKMDKMMILNGKKMK